MTDETRWLAPVVLCSFGALLSLAHNIVAAPITEIMATASALAGSPVYHHQLGKVIAHLRPHLLTQAPFLATESLLSALAAIHQEMARQATPEDEEAVFWAWVDTQRQHCGATFEILPITPPLASTPIADFIAQGHDPAKLLLLDKKREKDRP